MKTATEKQKIKEELKLLEKTLKRCRYSKNTKSIIREKQEHYLKSRDMYPSLETKGYIGKNLEDDKYKALVSKQYVVGQAYNKSGFQVLSRVETQDSSTGKRR